MNNKKNILLIGGVVVVVIAAVITFLLLNGSRKNNCATALPRQVTLLGRVNPLNLANQQGWTEEDLPQLKGIDLTTDSYVFGSQGYFGAIVPLSDADDFQKMLEADGCTIQKQRGLRWAVWHDSFLLCMDGHKAMLMGPATLSEQDALRNTLATCIKQKAEESGMQSPEFKRLSERDAAAALVGNLGIIPEEYTSYLTMVMPKDVSRQDILFAADLSIRPDYLTLKMDLSSENGKVNQFFSDLNEAMLPLEGNLLDKEPKGAFVSVNVGLVGDKFLDLLRKNQDIRTKLLAINMGMDLDMIIKSVRGDLSLVVPQWSLSAPKGIMYASLSNDQFMENVNEWNGGLSKLFGLSFIPTTNNGYLAKWGKQAYYFGVRDKVLYVANDEQMSLLENRQDVTASNDIQAYKFFATVDMKDMREMLQLLSSVLPTKVSSYLQRCEKVQLMATGSQQWTLQFVLK